jgi:hypothetical protein
LELRFYPEPQTDEVKLAYMDRVPVDIMDRIMESRHLMEHGIVTYSHPALEGALDFFEHRFSREARHMKADAFQLKRQIAEAPNLTSQQRLQAMQVAERRAREAERIQNMLIALGQGRVAGELGPKQVAGILLPAYVQVSISQAILEFIHFEVKPTHPLEECPNPL